MWCQPVADLIAERLAAIGGSPEGRPSTIADTTTLAPFPAHTIGAGEALRALEAESSHVIDALSADIAALSDVVTVDLYTTVLEHLDKHRWFIRSHE